jgi:hypothetical protein
MATAISSISLAFAPMGTLAFGSISANYAKVITLLFPARILVLRNETDHDVIFQTTRSNVAPASDGTNDGIYIASGETLTLDASANKSEQAGYSAFADGVVFWVRAPGTLPTTGAVWVSYVYALTN